MIKQQIVDDKVHIRILGTQSPFCSENSACPSYLIEYNNNKILLDCGSGSHRFFDFKKIENLNIFVSHFHYDHFNDLYNYMYTSYAMKNLNKITYPLNIYLPTYPHEIYSNIKNSTISFAEYHDIDEYKKYDIDGIKVDFCKIEHDRLVENYAIRVSIGDKKIVYSGDCSYSSKNKLIEFAKNADILICESSLLKEHNFPEICNHLTAFQAGTIAQQANVKTLILTHFWAEEKVEKYLIEAKKVFTNTFIAKEKAEYIL